MTYDQRSNQARTDTTRHLKPEDRDGPGGVVGYLEGARERSARFAESTSRLREIRAEIDTLGREAHHRPTGVLSGGDVDIAYYYLGVVLGVAALLYSVMGTVFALHGGSDALLTPILSRWSAGPATAVAEALLNVRTLVAVILQAILFVVIIGTRRNPQSWQHWAALIGSAALTYAGWSSLLITYGEAPLTSFTAAVPAALVGGALGWAIVRSSSEQTVPRPLMIGIIGAGVVAGALGVTALIHWVGLLLAWSADQVARKVMVVG
jgi:uncharacterized membrane protein